MSMLCDCHIHTQFSGDSETPVRDQLERAIALGMDTVCLTDHHDWGATDRDGVPTDRFTLDFDRCVPALEAIREEYRGRLDVRIGVELGLQLRAEADTREVLRRWRDRLDYIIGSNHFIDAYDVYYPEWHSMSPLSDPEAAERERYRRFFEISLERIQHYSAPPVPAFDSLGHLDFVVRYGPNKNRNYSFKAYADVLEPILETLVRRDLALEVNSGGFKYGLEQPNPAADILTRYRELGGKLITVGSDAHVPGFVGFEFARTAELLRSLGFREYAVYRSHRPELRAL